MDNNMTMNMVEGDSGERERVNDLLLKQNQFPHQSVYASNNKQLSSSSIKG
jgi:hypothetical protein